MADQEQVKVDVITNKQFALKNDWFRAACVKAGIEPTTRQASKWRLKKGKAYAFKGVKEEVKDGLD